MVAPRRPTSRWPPPRGGTTPRRPQRSHLHRAHPAAAAPVQAPPPPSRLAPVSETGARRSAGRSPSLSVDVASTSMSRGCDTRARELVALAPPVALGWRPAMLCWRRASAAAPCRCRGAAQQQAWRVAPGLEHLTPWLRPRRSAWWRRSARSPEGLRHLAVGTAESAAMPVHLPAAAPSSPRDAGQGHCCCCGADGVAKVMPPTLLGREGRRCAEEARPPASAARSTCLDGADLGTARVPCVARAPPRRPGDLLRCLDFDDSGCRFVALGCQGGSLLGCSAVGAHCPRRALPPPAVPWRSAASALAVAGSENLHRPSHPPARTPGAGAAQPRCLANCTFPPHFLLPAHPSRRTATGRPPERWYASRTTVWRRSGLAPATVGTTPAPHPTSCPAPSLAPARAAIAARSGCSPRGQRGPRGCTTRRLRPAGPSTAGRGPRGCRGFWRPPPKAALRSATGSSAARGFRASPPRRRGSLLGPTSALLSPCRPSCSAGSRFCSCCQGWPAVVAAGIATAASLLAAVGRLWERDRL